MQVALELSGHPKANVRQVVISRTTVVGRSRDCGLQIASGSVSRKHCEIRIAGDAVSVVDLGSSNGTFVGPDRLPAGEERPLPSGTRLNVGGVRFVVSYTPAGRGVEGQTPSTAGVAAAEPEVAGETIPAGSAILGVDSDDVPFVPAEPILVDDALSTERTLEMPASNHDFDVIEEAFGGPEPLLADEPGTPVAATRAEEPILEADEDPILASAEPSPPVDEPIVPDEDEAFSFLMDEGDEPSDPSKTKAEDSRLGDFLNQLGRD